MKSLTLLSLLLGTIVASSALTSCRDHYYGPRGGGYGHEEWRDDREERRDDVEELRDDVEETRDDRRRGYW